MRPHEVPPRALFGELLSAIEKSGPVGGFLFNSGSESLHRCAISDIKVAPPGTKISAINLASTPEYYNRGRYPAWLRLSRIDDVSWQTLSLRYAQFPTRPGDTQLASLVGAVIKSPQELRNGDVTLWAVTEARRRN